MEKSSFFNAVESNGTYDRVYKAEDFADYFNKFIGNGIFYKKSDYCQITATGNDMNIIENIGSAYINGYAYSNTTALTKAITVADGVLDRIDLVVLRLDYVNREIKLYIKESAFASTPVCPSLQRDADAYELGLAQIYVKHGATSISQADITDLRLDSAYCGIVTGLITQLDFSTASQQFDAQMNELIEKTRTTADTFTSDFKESVREWFMHLRNELDSNQAANLQNQIDNKAECKIGTGIMTAGTTQVVIENAFFTDKTFINLSVDTDDKWTWKTETGKLTITSDFDETIDTPFSYCATNQGMGVL